MKYPSIKLNGNATFKGANFYGGLPTKNPALDVVGHVKANIDFVDHYKDAYGNGTRSQYVTYLKSIVIDGKTKEDAGLKLPGDIPSSAKERGLSIPLYSILGSSNNILILIASTIMALIVGFSDRRAKTEGLNEFLHADTFFNSISYMLIYFMWRQSHNERPYKPNL